jgi:hypothetical protein
MLRPRLCTEADAPIIHFTVLVYALHYPKVCKLFE